ncbi:MAG: CRISPR-associated endonuclease Cas2 [Bacteroidales bacterium]|nr:CRISPR-associated endonuclease Cas2 [Bacteroidales bacterium]
MMILITYDVDTTSEAGKKRLRKVAKECVNYGRRVQNSVFECLLTEAQFCILKNKIESIINEELDSVRFYFLGNNWNKRIESVGKMTTFAIDAELII